MIGLLFACTGLEVGALAAASIGAAASAATGISSYKSQKKAASEERAAQKKAADEAAAQQQQAAAARANTGSPVNAQAAELALQRRRGVQSTFLTSRMAGGETKLGA